MEIAVVVPSFRGAFRLQRMLESVLVYDSLAFRNASWLIVEDPSDERATRDYEKVVRDFPVEFTKLAQWSNMHGAARAAFELVAVSRPEWVVYLGDDVLATPFAVSNLLFFLKENELKTLGLVQVPYWNAHQLCAGSLAADAGPALLRGKEEMYSNDASWLVDVPRNPHWEGEGYARPYVNVNGCGFAARLSNYQRVGGFAEGTWCLDESISVRTWLRGSLGIVCLPGPCFVHYFGAASASGMPAHDMYTDRRWELAMGMTKQEANRLSYERMFARTPAILEETKNAEYLYNAFV